MMEIVLHGVTVRIDGDRVTHGARTFHKEAVPAALKAEIKKAMAAATARASTPTTKRHANESNIEGRNHVSARATQRKVYRKG